MMGVGNGIVYSFFTFYLNHQGHTVSSVLKSIPYVSSRSLLCCLLWWEWKRKKVFLSKDCCNAVRWDFGQTFWKCHECWKTSNYQRFWRQNSDKLFLLCWTQGISYYLATLAQYKISVGFHFGKDLTHYLFTIMNHQRISTF